MARGVTNVTFCDTHVTHLQPRQCKAYREIVRGVTYPPLYFFSAFFPYSERNAQVGKSVTNVTTHERRGLEAVFRCHTLSQMSQVTNDAGCRVFGLQKNNRLAKK
jgi:hypothetical protein